MIERENRETGLGIEKLGHAGTQLYRIRPHTETHLVVARWKRHLSQDECDAVLNCTVSPQLIATDDLVEYYPLAMTYRD